MKHFYTFCLSFCLLVCISSCTNNSTSTTENTETISETDSLKQDSTITALQDTTAKPQVKPKDSIPPKAVVDPVNNIRKEDLVIPEEGEKYDPTELEAAFNQLTHNLKRKAQKIVMAEIREDFENIDKENTVTGSFIDEAEASYTIQGYMRRLTMTTDERKVKIVDFKTNKEGKIVSIKVKETAKESI